MLFYSFFKTLVGKPVVVELKNDVCISGTLTSVDPFLNFKLENISVTDVERYPYLLSVKDVFIRGSVVRYVSLQDKSLVDISLLRSSCRKELYHLMNKVSGSVAAAPAEEEVVEGEDS